MHLTSSTLLKTLALVLSLGLDTFAVAIGLGIAGLDRPARFRFAGAFALAEGLMPLLGFALGHVAATALGEITPYVAIALLFGVALYMIWEARHEEERSYTGTSLITLGATALTVSFDELAAGFSLGLLRIPLALAAPLIAAQAFALTLIGTALGHRLGEAVGERAEMLSGVVLALLAIFLLGEQLLTH
jgi:putative Mn2+ efflux pump MntP